MNKARIFKIILYVILIIIVSTAGVVTGKYFTVGPGSPDYGKSSKSSQTGTVKSSRGNPFGLYTYKSSQVDLRITVSPGSSNYPDIWVYFGYTYEGGIEGHADGTIKDNILYENGVIKNGSIDRNGRWLKWGRYTLRK